MIILNCCIISYHPHTYEWLLNGSLAMNTFTDNNCIQLSIWNVQLMRIVTHFFQFFVVAAHVHVNFNTNFCFLYLLMTLFLFRYYIFRSVCVLLLFLFCSILLYFTWSHTHIQCITHTHTQHIFWPLLTAFDLIIYKANIQNVICNKVGCNQNCSKKIKAKSVSSIRNTTNKCNKVEERKNKCSKAIKL